MRPWRPIGVLAGALALGAELLLACCAAVATAAPAPASASTSAQEVVRLPDEPGAAEAPAALVPASVPAARPPASGYAERYLLRLRTGPFPGSPHPQALIHIPPSFSPRGPVNLVVFLHGWNNCAENVAGDVDSMCDPALDAGDGPRPAYGLIRAMDDARKDAVLAVLQLAWDAPSNDDGTLATPGGFRDIVAEILADLPPPAGPRALGDLGRVVLVSHSGAYVAAADILDHGGLGEHVSDVYLLDSLYGRADAFESWIERRLLGAKEGAGAPRAKFADIYLPGCGTDGPSEDLAATLRAALRREPGTGGRGAGTDAERGAGPGVALDVDDGPDDALPASALRASVLFKISSLDHDRLPRFYFTRLLRASLLPDGPEGGPGRADTTVGGGEPSSE